MNEVFAEDLNSMYRNNVPICNFFQINLRLLVQVPLCGCTGTLAIVLVARNCTSPIVDIILLYTRLHLEADEQYGRNFLYNTVATYKHDRPLFREPHNQGSDGATTVPLPGSAQDGHGRGSTVVHTVLYPSTVKYRLEVRQSMLMRTRRCQTPRTQVNKHDVCCGVCNQQ